MKRMYYIIHRISIKFISILKAGIVNISNTYKKLYEVCNFVFQSVQNRCLLTSLTRV